MPKEAVAAFPSARRGYPDLHRTPPVVDRSDVEALDEEVLAGGEVVHREVQRLAAETVVAEERRRNAEGGMDPGLVPRQLTRGGEWGAVAMTRPVHPATHGERHERGGAQVAHGADESERGDGGDDGLGRSPLQVASVPVEPGDRSAPCR